MRDRAHIMADEALLLCGTDFRLHGRDVEHGVDCVGLTALCAAATDLKTPVPDGYSIRSGNVSVICELMELSGFEKFSSQKQTQDGDILLVRISPVQLHFMICAEDGYVHAHAGLRKVVFSPGPCPWTILHVFRILES